MTRTLQKFLPQFVYGGVDGTITTFAIVAGTLGAGLPPSVIVILGSANLCADGFSMAASSFLSDSSAQELKSVRPHNSFKVAVVTFLSFVGVGLIPLLPFIFDVFGAGLGEKTIPLAALLAALALLFIGATRGAVVGKSKVGTALTTLLIGGIAAVIAFYVGSVLGGVV